jgi:mitochondrial fission protein ELM1
LDQPRVWLLLGPKAGDNTQVKALADELGWDTASKFVVARRWELLTHLALRVTLAGIDRAASSDLLAPWPDLVITAGRRNEPVARWIAAQSGGRCRLVQFGRPWAPLNSYDLIVTTPQYFLPDQSNIIHNKLPLHRLGAQDLEAEEAAMASKVSNLPRPVIAVLVGGDSGRFVFTAAKGAALGQACSDLARKQAGSLLVIGSPRTPPAVFTALRNSLQGCPHESWAWGDPGSNPYHAALALADQFVVTGESMSMLSEASAMGRPLHIFDVGDGDTPWWTRPHNYRYKPLSHRLAMTLGPQRMRRDIGNIQQALVGAGAAVWLGDTPGAVAVMAPEEELARTAQRVREMMQG